jgi:hypothetical protein
MILKLAHQVLERVRQDLSNETLMNVLIFIGLTTVIVRFVEDLGSSHNFAINVVPIILASFGVLIIWLSNWHKSMNAVGSETQINPSKENWILRLLRYVILWPIFGTITAAIFILGAIILGTVIGTFISICLGSHTNGSIWFLSTFDRDGFIRFLIPVISVIIILNLVGRWFGEGIGNCVVILGLIFIFVWPEWISPSYECNNYAREFNLTKEGLASCKKYEDSRNIYREREIAILCQHYKEKLHLDEDVLASCQHSKNFRNSLEDFKTTLEYESPVKTVLRDNGRVILPYRESTGDE